MFVKLLVLSINVVALPLMSGFLNVSPPTTLRSHCNFSIKVRRLRLGDESSNELETEAAEKERLLRLQVAELGSLLKGTNLYFIGMMGTGKSTVARAMADRLGPYSYVDTDAIIEQLMKAPVSEIFEQRGEAEFRDIETQVLSELHSYVKLVVSTGGGIVLKKKTGLVVWLDMNVSDLSTRLLSDEKEIWKRPLLRESDARGKLQQIFENRKEMYSQADVRVPISLDDDVVTVVKESCSALRKFIDSNPPKWQQWKDAARENGVTWLQ